MGAYEFVNNKNRYCLWLLNANPTELKKIPLIMQRIEMVRQERLANADKSDVEVFKTSECFCMYSVLTMMGVVNKTMKIGLFKISTSLYYLISFYGILGWSNYL